MVRRQLPMAFQGLVVIPLFCGYDPDAGRGRLYSFDVVGGRYEEAEYAAEGSGGRDARLYLRGTHRPDLDEDGSIRLAIEALVAAAEEDTATGGPDLRRGIYPSVVIVSADGVKELPDDVVGEASRSVMGEDHS
jgi:proteasome beta subunit